MSKHRREELTIGEDSFLDTMANLVGILIIFVVIAAFQAKTVVETIISQPAIDEQTLAVPVATAEKVQADVIKLMQELQKHAIEVAYRREERDQILDRVNLLKAKLDEQTSSVSEKELHDITSLTEYHALEKQLKDILNQQGLVGAAQSQVVALEHLPTPMAKTVFSEEVHVMLQKGRVALIPWDRLVESLKKNANLEVRRSHDKDAIESKLGPIEGFMMFYRFVSKRGVVSNGQSTAMAQVVELDRFELEPTDQVIRESISQAMSDSGRLRIELAGRVPQRTVVTIWTYPDSFDEFRRLKEALFAEGYLSAARPLPEHVRIGASPRGSNSLSQ